MMNQRSLAEVIAALQRRLSLLVVERQALRERCASPSELERNRREIVSDQRALSVALGAHFRA
jgi:hypothetical protein